MQASAFKEFGDYMEFRRSIPESLDLEADTKGGIFTAGIFTEFVKQRKVNRQFGFKAALSFSNIIHPPKEYYKTDYDANGGYSRKLLWGSDKDLRQLPYYISFTYFVKRQSYYGFAQVSSGVDLTSFQLGMLYSLGRKTFAGEKAKD